MIPWIVSFPAPPLSFSFDAKKKQGNYQELEGRRGKPFITSHSDQSGVSLRTIVKARFTVSAHKTPTTKLWDGPLLHKYSRNVSEMAQLWPSLTCNGSSCTGITLLLQRSYDLHSQPSKHQKYDTSKSHTNVVHTHTHTQLVLWLHTAHARNIELQIFHCVNSCLLLSYTPGRAGSNPIQTIEHKFWTMTVQPRNVPLWERRYKSTHS